MTWDLTGLADRRPPFRAIPAGDVAIGRSAVPFDGTNALGRRSLRVPPGSQRMAIEGTLAQSRRLWNLSSPGQPRRAQGFTARSDASADVSGSPRKWENGGRYSTLDRVGLIGATADLEYIDVLYSQSIDVDKLVGILSQEFYSPDRRIGRPTRRPCSSSLQGHPLQGGL
jgi:hypothetical protein